VRWSIGVYRNFRRSAQPACTPHFVGSAVPIIVFAMMLFMIFECNGLRHVAVPGVRGHPYQSFE
jgi:hypothetical protein